MHTSSPLKGRRRQRPARTPLRPTGIACSTLTSPYPTADMTVPCSLCLRPVDRTSPRVSVSMTQFEDESQPWLVSARVVDERELAVYCPGCAEPRRTSAFDESELGVAV